MKVWIVGRFSVATNRNCCLGIGSTRKDAIEDAGGHRALPKGRYHYTHIGQLETEEAIAQFPDFEMEIDHYSTEG